MNKIGTSRQKYSLLMEMQWVCDPSGNIENWGLTDVEKIINEAWHMNPHGPADMRLPGECFIYVGQNPKVGSSIKQTQHTQLCEASCVDYPMLKWSTNAQWLEQLQSHVDIVDVGPYDRSEEERGMFVKITTDRPASSQVAEFLAGMRIKLLVEFGGSDKIDFLCGCMADELGRFVIILAPIAQLQKVDGRFMNPLTGENAEEAELDEPRIDFGKGVGHYLVERDALRQELMLDAEGVIRCVYAFNRVPQVRQAIEAYLAGFLTPV
jgi:hypothetical protein